jgi:uncharacterized protein YijF (DUF1287 family)
MNGKKKLLLIILLALVVCLTAVEIWLGSPLLWETSARRLRDQYQGSIAAYQSPTDKDGDGIDDQTDILKSALSYVKTHPKYASKYYAAGYPDDGYGVCTDVVAFALKGAGYDLMELVEEDIQANPSSYEISQPDKRIDFRRVNNLKIYFDHTAQSLTTDIYAIEEWQGGDIVVFHNHIGIVSDRRNVDGVPYVIHHSAPDQVRYEQDILETREDLVAHYRISG